MFSIDYKSVLSINQQIKEEIKTLILNGIYKPDDKLPSVRELSVLLTVNPNTVQKAYKELENEGYIYSVSGKGSFVSTVEEKAKMNTDKLYDDLIKAVKELSFLGEKRESVINVINNIFDENN